MAAYLNLSPTRRCLVKRFAKLCSVTIRKSKFNRVSDDFLDGVSAEVEKLRREIAAKHGTVVFPDILDSKNNACPTPAFLSPQERKAILREIEFMIARTIQRKVERHPSVGKTLH